MHVPIPRLSAKGRVAAKSPAAFANLDWSSVDGLLKSFSAKGDAASHTKGVQDDALGSDPEPTAVSELEKRMGQPAYRSAIQKVRAEAQARLHLEALC